MYNRHSMHFTRHCDKSSTFYVSFPKTTKVLKSILDKMFAVPIPWLKFCIFGFSRKRLFLEDSRILGTCYLMDSATQKSNGIFRNAPKVFYLEFPHKSWF